MSIRKSTESDYHERIRRVTRHLQDHLDENPDLGALAAIACFSPFHFHRIFRGIVGESVAEHVRRLRLERAAARLRNSLRPVTDLAFEAGYDTLEAFTRAFRRQFGLPPSTYRRLDHAIRLDDQGVLRNLPLTEAGALLPDLSPTIADYPALRVAYVRHTGPYETCQGAWAALCRWAGPRGLIGPNTRFIGLCYDSPDITRPGHIRYEAALTLNAPLPSQGEVGIQEIPAGEYAVCLHRGSFDRLKNTYAALGFQWFPQSGREMKWGPSLEVYLTDPARVPPEENQVEIRIPLEPTPDA